MSLDIRSAAHCALMWHHGQKRKYRGEPYIVHLAEVAGLLHHYGLGEEVIAAGWLHDVVEDTGIGISHIENAFGARVADLVMSVTDVSTHDGKGGNRAERKRRDREHYARACPYGKAIKLADLISNTRSIVADDPDFAKVYLVEKRKLLEVLMDSASPHLEYMANDMLVAGERKIVEHFKLRAALLPRVHPEQRDDVMNSIRAAAQKSAAADEDARRIYYNHHPVCGGDPLCAGCSI
jgi:hypothetical protein